MKATTFKKDEVGSAAAAKARDWREQGAGQGAGQGGRPGGSATHWAALSWSLPAVHHGRGRGGNLEPVRSSLVVERFAAA